VNSNAPNSTWWINGIRVLIERPDGSRRMLQRGRDWQWLPKTSLFQYLVIRQPEERSEK